VALFGTRKLTISKIIRTGIRSLPLATGTKECGAIGKTYSLYLF
jgi:hypothetical protein